MFTGPGGGVVQNFTGWFKETNLHSYDSGSGLLPVAWGLIICQDHRGVVCYVCDGNDSGLENNQKKIIRSRDRDIHCSFPIIIFRCDLPSRRNVTPSTQTGDFADRHLGFVLKFSLPSRWDVKFAPVNVFFNMSFSKS